MMMQEISKQMAMGKQVEQEKAAEVEKLKQDIKKMEQEKKAFETQIAGLTMQVQKDCDMIVQF